MNTTVLKVGILLDAYEVPAWLYNSIQRIVNSHYAAISVIICHDRQHVYTSTIDKLSKNRNKIAYYIFYKIDRYLFREKPDAFKIKNIQEILLDVPTVKVKPLHKNYSYYFDSSDIARIRSYDLDILIRADFSVLRGDILTSSKYGIWSYHHGDNRVNRGGPPGFWEAIENWPETGSILQILSEDLHGGKVLYRSWSSTYTLSPSRNRNYYYWTSSSFLPRQIERLYRLGGQEFFKEVRDFNQDFTFYCHRLYKTPLNLEALRLFSKYLYKIIVRIWQKLVFLEQWYLMFDLKPDISTSFSEFKTIVPPKDRSWSDPHVIQSGRSFYVFVEVYIYKIKKGHISVIAMDNQGNYSEPVQVLEKHYHLSHPFVFKWENKYYMVPESKQNGTVELYECIEFPYKWELKMDLMANVRAADTTLFYHDKKWWLFTSIAENEGSSNNDELFLFSSNELFTEKWTAHPLNPIISDAKRARAAGRIFCRNGRVFRPSQDCSLRYGHRININEVVVLSETEYFEKKVASVTPNWDKKVKATHTFAKEGQLTVIDAFSMRRKFL